MLILALERGKVFIGAYKVDPLENGQYNIYVKRKDFLSDE